MIKNILSGIEGVSIYPIISLLVFFLFFIGVSIYAFKMPKKKREHLENLPLED